MKERFLSFIQNLQDEICGALEQIDGQAKFREDLWDRPEGGGPILAAKRRFTKTAAMDYADTHYPMEKK